SLRRSLPRHAGAHARRAQAAREALHLRCGAGPRLHRYAPLSATAVVPAKAGTQVLNVSVVVPAKAGTQGFKTLVSSSPRRRDPGFRTLVLSSPRGRGPSIKKLVPAVAGTTYAVNRCIHPSFDHE